MYATGRLFVVESQIKLIRKPPPGEKKGEECEAASGE